MEDLTRSYSTINQRCCCFNMRKVMRAVTQYYDRYLEQVGIRATQFTLLVALSSKVGRTLTEIAENLVMDRTTLTRNLKPLEKLGYITTIQPLDRRSKAYVLTDAGKEVLAKGAPLWEKAQNSVVSSLGDEQYNALVKELEKLLRATMKTSKS